MESSTFSTNQRVMRGDRMKPLYNFNTPIKTIIPSREDWGNNHTSYLDESCINVYTDGSKMSGRTGAGVFSAEISVSEPLGVYTTVFQAEVYAISVAACEILKQSDGSRPIRILTDSQAAIRAIGAWKFTSRLVNDCRIWLGKLAERRPVILMWIPGHSNFDGNERADALARQGSSLNFLGPEPVLNISQATRKIEIMNRLRETQIEIWNNLETCRQAREMFTGPSLKAGQFFISNARNKVRTLTNVLTGHCLNRHLFRLKVVSTPTCRGCGEQDETAKHFLCECPSLAKTRKKYLGQYFLNTRDIQQSALGDIASFAMKSGWTVI